MFRKEIVMKRQGRKEMDLVEEGLVLAPLENWPAEETKWLWPGRIARGSVTMLVGYPEVGKSFVALDIAARVTRGAAWPDGAANDGPGGAMLLSAEDHLIRKVRPAMDNGKADYSRFQAPYRAFKRIGEKQTFRPINFKRDLRKLEFTLARQRDCKLLIVDPLNAYMGSGAGMRGVDGLYVIRTLYDLACQYDVAVLLVAHFKPGSSEAMYRAVGGMGLTTMVRAIWAVVKGGTRGQRSEAGGQPSTSSGQGRSGVKGRRRLLLPVKNNLEEGVLGLEFWLRKYQGEKVPRVEWESKAIGLSVDAALARRKKRMGPAAVQRKEAVGYLRQALGDGRRLVKEVEAEAKEVYGITLRTLERARKALRTQSFRIDGVGPYWMELPRVKEKEIETRKIPGGPGGPEEKAGNHEEIEQESGPPLGGPGGASGGPVAMEESE
jgi:hypothetical protein